MSRKPASPVLQLIRRTLEDEQVRDLPDHELLTRLGQRDAAAFDGLLRRHGPMVLDVCRSVLGNEDDAEDAFQATFLILARRASAIRKKTSVGSWLHGVAYRTALKARASFAQRHKHEARKATPVASEASDEVSWRDVQQALHTELNRFSERYRAPLVLCYLEGRTQDEAAGVLGVSKATLKKHLERARELLRARLVRRGLGPAAVLAAAVWPAATSSASVPLTLAATLLDAVTKPTLGQTAGPVSSRVAVLTEGVLRAMFYTKLRMIAALAGVFALLPLLGAVALRGHAEAEEPTVTALGPSTPNDDQAKQKPANEEHDELFGDWVNVETKKAGVIRLRFTTGTPRPNSGTSLHIVWKPPVDESSSTSSSGPGGTTTTTGGGVAGPGGGAGGVAGGGGGFGGGVGPIPGGGFRGVRVLYEINVKDGKKILTVHYRDDKPVEVPYRLDGDTLTLNGGTFEVGKRGDRPAIITVDLKGTWKRVDVGLEKRFHQASPSLSDIETYPIKIESRSQRILVAANEAIVQPDGRLRLNECIVVRLAPGKDGAAPEAATVIRSGHALFKLTEPAHSVTDLARGILSVEFPEGVRLNLKEP